MSVCNAVINMYGKAGDVRNALNVFGRSKVPNVVSWTLIMAAFSK